MYFLFLKSDHCCPQVACYDRSFTARLFWRVNCNSRDTQWKTRTKSKRDAEAIRTHRWGTRQCCGKYQRNVKNAVDTAIESVLHTTLSACPLLSGTYINSGHRYLLPPATIINMIFIQKSISQMKKSVFTADYIWRISVNATCTYTRTRFGKVLREFSSNPSLQITTGHYLVI